MRRGYYTPRAYGSGPRRRAWVGMTPELLALVDQSAKRSGLSRSGEIKRLIRLALEKECPEPPETREVRGHVV